MCTILQAERNDLQEILNLQYLAYQSEAALFGTQDIPPLKQTLDELTAEYESGLILKMVGDAQKIIGSVRAKEQDGTVYIGKLMVHPDCRCHGYGSRLLAEIESRFPQKRYELFTSTRSKDNIRLYEKAGYRAFGSRQITDELRFVYMEKYGEHRTYIDISQEVFSCRTFPGDPAPKKQRVLSIENGDVCNLTAFSMCAHNGTHLDAPYHFIPDGKTVDMLDPAALIGDCYVARREGALTAADAADILSAARAKGAAQRILIAGKAVVTADAARVFAQAGILLIGNESQTVGPEDAPKEVHLILLGAGIVLLEGIVLTYVQEGRYLLFAAPLNLDGCDGAPCRAYLVR